MTVEQRLENIESILNQLLVMVSVPKSADDPDHVSPAREAQIRLMARQNMATLAIRKQEKKARKQA